jgi:hypothetical protein
MSRLSSFSCFFLSGDNVQRPRGPSGAQVASAAEGACSPGDVSSIDPRSHIRLPFKMDRQQRWVPYNQKKKRGSASTNSNWTINMRSREAILSHSFEFQVTYTKDTRIGHGQLHYVGQVGDVVVNDLIFENCKCSIIYADGRKETYLLRRCCSVMMRQKIPSRSVAENWRPLRWSCLLLMELCANSQRR